MSSYKTFAEFYDCLTENVDYKVRSDYISNFFSLYGKKELSVLDLACGTGNLSSYLAIKGYDVIGLDLSEEMLIQANSKLIDNALFVKGDMTEFQLPCKVNYCVCSLDSINHLTSISKVGNCFKCVYESINKDGIFVFDVNTKYKHEFVLGDNTFVFDEDDFFLSWDNEYLDNDTVKIILDFFVYNGKNYDRYSEEFCERAYDIETLSNLLVKIGFEILGVYDELTQNPPKEDSERIYFVCKRK